MKHETVVPLRTSRDYRDGQPPDAWSQMLDAHRERAGLLPMPLLAKLFFVASMLLGAFAVAFVVRLLS